MAEQAEDAAPKFKGKQPTSAGWILTDVEQGTGHGNPVQTKAYVQRRESGAISVKNFDPKLRLDYFSTVNKQFIESSKFLSPQEKQNLHTMSNARRDSRHKDRVAEDIVKHGLPRAEQFLKNALETYMQKINASLQEFISKGGQSPYDFVRVEYNVMKGTLPLEVIKNDPRFSDQLEHLLTFSLVKDEAGNDAITAAYLRVDKVLTLTPETIARKEQEAAMTNTPNPVATGEHRELLYHAFVPIGEITFNSAKYQLLNDYFYQLIALGMEHTDYLKYREKQHEAEIQRENIASQVNDIEEIFKLKVEKGGANEATN
jgi:hypothetical protein